MDEMFAHFFSLKVISAKGKDPQAVEKVNRLFREKGVNSLSQQVVYNSALRTRSAVSRFYLPKPSEGQSISVKFNNQHVPSVVQTNYQCDQLLVQEDLDQISLVVEIPEIPPASMNLLSVEVVNDATANKTETSLKSEMQQLGEANKKYLENDQLRVKLDEEEGAYLPTEIYFKKLN